jgi:peptide subunit release factor 1 (eRF1)
MQPPETTSPGADFAPLRELLAKRRTVAVVLLRLGAYAVGVIDDGELVASKTGTRYVHGRHRAGGQSQRRFERNREQWIRALFDRVCQVAQDRFKPYEGRIDHLAFGGDRHVLARFMKACEALNALEDRLLRRTTPVERPGLGALRQACDSIWESRVATAPDAR